MGTLERIKALRQRGYSFDEARRLVCGAQRRHTPPGARREVVSRGRELRREHPELSLYEVKRLAEKEVEDK